MIGSVPTTYQLPLTNYYLPFATYYQDKGYTMPRSAHLLIGCLLALLLAGCGVKVFISDTRMGGAVPSAAEVAAAEATAAVELVNATPTASAAETDEIDQIIDDLTARVGEGLIATEAFSGKETPNAGPLRGMRVEAGDHVRISAGRSQEVAVEASEYCRKDDKSVCSRVWLHGRPNSGSMGAWYPVVIFDYVAK